MTDVPANAPPPKSVPRWRRWLLPPPPGLEGVIWCIIAASAVGLRWWVATHLPGYVWTRDSGSYLSPAVSWLERGQWVTSARRGPVYSLFLAGIFKLGGTLTSVANIQAALGILTTFLTIAFARVGLGYKSAWPLVVCSIFYVFYGMPLELERLVRNETLLVFFATLAFGSWAFTLRSGATPWAAAGGLCAGLMHLLKGIFPIFPVIVIITLIWAWRRQPARAALLTGVYLALFLLPIVSSKLYSRMSGTQRPAEPEDGQMFLGRTAQWVYFGADGVSPDLKPRIHDQVAAYAERFQRTGKLDNNEIVKRTVVPTLKKVIIDEGGGTLVDVNRASWRLGLEAARHHPGAYLSQFGHDLYYLNFISAQRMTPFDPKQLQSADRDARAFVEATAPVNPTVTRLFDLEKSHGFLHRASESHSSLQRFARFMRGLGRLRLISPVFLTTLFLPLLAYVQSGRERLFWLGSSLLWYYYLVLLSTVGRPLDRYLMPVIPLMYWSVCAVTSLAWLRWCSSLLGNRSDAGGDTLAPYSVGVESDTPAPGSVSE